MMFRVFGVFSALAMLKCYVAADNSCPEGYEDKHNRVWRLRSRPVGEIADTDLELVHESVPAIGEGQMLVKNLYISMDPTHRIWMSDKAQYMPKVELDDVMRAATVGVVEVSHNLDYPVGMKVVGFGGVQDYYVGIPGATVLYEAKDTPPDGVPLTAHLSVNSIIIGLTAWHGVRTILDVGEGDVFVVSGGAGAVGSLAGQLAKVKGATVIGIAGSPAKCARMKDDFGFDFAINYKTDDVEAALAAAAPEGITHYFDNVGGVISDAVFTNARNYAKIALCGSISEYDDNWAGQKNYNMILMRRVTVTGFICMDHMDEMPAAMEEIAGLVQQGKLKYDEDIREGLETYITTVKMLYTGANTGKLILKV